MRIPLRIALCGGLVVELDGARIEARLAGRQGREVFAYLVLNRARRVSRDEVTALLWPEQAPRSPDAALNTVLARLRRVLGQEALGGRGQLRLVLPPDSWIDVESAERDAALAETRLAAGDPPGARRAAGAALELLAAPLLPELQHTWVQQWRSDLDDLVIRLLAVQVRAGLVLGGDHLQDAERSAQRLIEREPFRESGYGMLMEVLAVRGEVAEALRVYERLRRLLRDELGVPPSPQLAAQHERLLREHPTPSLAAPSPAAPSPAVAGASAGVAQSAPAAATAPPLPGPLARDAATVLAGRERELAALRAPWEQPDGDRPSVALVAGEPGIGKSTLVAALAREVHREHAAIVLHGEAEEEPIVPYVAVVQALRQYLADTPGLVDDERLRPHLAELRWLIPEIPITGEERTAAPDARADRLRLYRAAASVLVHAASEHPVLLVLEDLQWADSDTLLVVRQLLRETTRRPLRAVLTYRAEEVDDDHPLTRTLAELRRNATVTRIALSGLDDAGVRAMLRERNGDGDDGGLDSELLRRLREHTSGNPFFIGEVVRSLEELGTGIDDPGGAAGTLPQLPEGVLAVISERLRRLPEPTRDTLAAAAILGDDVGLELLEGVLGDGWRSTAIDPAVRSGLLVSDQRAGGRLRFCHALAREAIYAQIGSGRRAELHLAAARALERRRDALAVEPAQIAHHLAQSNHADTTLEAIAYLREAADRALARYAYDTASTHLQSAVELLERDRPQDSATRCELLLALGQVSWQAGSPRARAIHQQALAVARGLGHPERLAAAALGLGGRFYAPDATDVPYTELLEQTLQALGDTEPPLRTRVLGRLAEHLMLVDPERAVTLSEQALTAARAGDDPELLGATLLSRHAALLAVHYLPERLQLAGEQVALARALGDRELEALGLHWLLYDLLESGDVAAATAAHGRLRELAEELRQPLYRHSMLVWERELDQLAGRFERAEQLSHEALLLSSGAQGQAAKIHFVAQRLSVARDVGGVRRLLETSRRWPSEGSLLWLSARWLLELECGELHEDPDRDQAVAQIAALPRNVIWLATISWLAEVIADAGDALQATAVYELLAPHADRWIQLVFDGTFGSVRRPLGLLAGRMGRSEEAAALLHEAASEHARAGAVALQARTLGDHGRGILDGRVAGTQQQGRALLQSALELAETCHASRLAAQLAQTLDRAAQIGARNASPQTATTPSTVPSTACSAGGT